VKLPLAFVVSFALLSSNAAAHGSGHGSHHGSGTRSGTHTPRSSTGRSESRSSERSESSSIRSAERISEPRTSTERSTVAAPRSDATVTHYSHVPTGTAWLSKYTAAGNPVHRYHRSFEAKKQFWEMTGHPHGWPGHVVDHVNPLACGGADAPSNMQWQTIAEAKAKDKVERIGCHGGHR
jgi:hypothetical protein